ncbi:MAG: hypothetical protein QOI35_1128, partial [Cryptosporangiaceae bacterium]|nr:hypothetical protein [Cryptosporangiaceae bacterium]
MGRRLITTLLLESLFVLVFLRALAAYARSRDPLQRDVMLIFTAMAVLFAIQFCKAVLHVEPPALLGQLALGGLLLQPVFTLFLVAKIRPVPRAVFIPAIGAQLASAAAVAFSPPPLPPLTILVGVVCFLATEGMASGFFVAEARRRAGASQIRLFCAAGGSAAMALTILLLGLSPVPGAIGRMGAAGWRAAALTAAVAYIAAFVTPAWLRRHWAGAAASRVSQQLLHAPATEPAARTWERYAATVQRLAGADGALVLLHRIGGTTEVVASAELEDTDCPPGSAQLDALLAAPQPIRLDAPLPGTGEPLEAGIPLDIRYLTAIPLAVDDRCRGGLLLLNRYLTLFSDDDARLIGSLGTQAAILAERGAVLTEQARLAAELADSISALQRASEAKSDFLATMSHELRTPLNSIIGFSELMRTEDEQDGFRSVPDEWIEHIYSSGRRLLALINDILDLTKVEAGRMELRLEPLDVQAAVAEALSAIRPLADRKQLRLDTEVSPIRVHADTVRFRQMVDNLLSNAIKFTPDGGTITVGGAQSGDIGTVWVRDTGVGIAPGDQGRVFDEFQQVGDQSARTAGTGLGLALTRRLAEAHGGKIELTSDVGTGSRFTLHLPMAPENQPDPSVRAGGGDLDSWTGGILVIEDEPGAARLLRTHLESAGYRVRIVESGEAGLAAARNHAPEAILLDVMLPGMDG